ncbi:MAG: four helix bundle protein [Candidatus Levyibacteriota bacterium]
MSSIVMKTEMFNFEKLDVSKKAVNFANHIYGLTKSWPKEYRYSLTDQIQRASLSIALNLAEGASRTPLEFKRFISISRGSAHECVPVLEIAEKQGIIEKLQKEELLKELVVISKMLSSLKNSIN